MFKVYHVGNIIHKNQMKIHSMRAQKDQRRRRVLPNKAKSQPPHTASGIQFRPHSGSADYNIMEEIHRDLKQKKKARVTDLNTRAVNRATQSVGGEKRMTPMGEGIVNDPEHREQ